MKQFQEADYYLAFSLSPIGPKTFQGLLHYFKTAENIWNAENLELENARVGPKTLKKLNDFRKKFDLADYEKKLQKAHTQFLAFCSKKYPQKLKNLKDPPIGVFTKGNTALLHDNNLAIGVVGTRKMTTYGRTVTQKIVDDLVSTGTVIISGLALGVDACAHRTALDHNGKTIAVLGCGADCCYPKENEQLYNQILDSMGVIISEFPLSQMANRGTFPARNRIISALSDGILVTEAGVSSGSLITAKYAIEQGKKVFAIPGPITSATSSGTAELLKNGAQLITNGEEILQVFKINKTKKVTEIKNLSLTKDERRIMQILETENATTDLLSKKLEIPVIKVAILLSKLEMKGIISDNGNKIWQIRV